MQQSMRRIVPRHLIAAGFLLFMAGAFLTGGFFPFDIRELHDDTLLNWSMSAIVRDGGAILAVAAAIIFGLRSIRSHGTSRGRMAMVLTGIGIGLLFLTIGGIAHYQTGRLLKTYDFSKMIGLLEWRLRQPRLPEEKRPILLRKLAESRYLQSGERIMIASAGEAEAMYAPPPEIVGFRRNVVVSRQVLGWINRWTFYSSCIWVAVLLGAISVGVLVPEDYGRDG